MQVIKINQSISQAHGKELVNTLQDYTKWNKNVLRKTNFY